MTERNIKPGGQKMKIDSAGVDRLVEARRVSANPSLRGRHDQGAFVSTRGPDYGVALALIPFVASALMWFWVGNMNLLQSPWAYFSLISIATMLGTAVLSYMEFKAAEGARDAAELDDTPVTVLLAQLLIWIVGYPFYMAKRTRIGLPNLVLPALLGTVCFAIASGMIAAAIYKRQLAVQEAVFTMQDGLRESQRQIEKASDEFQQRMRELQNDR